MNCQSACRGQACGWHRAGNVESAGGIAPHHVHEVRPVGNAGHRGNEKGPPRSLRIGPMVAGVGFEPTTFGL
jgi:hypothetical protein